jgi:hypothetical protein
MLVLTNEEYQALSVAASKAGKPLDTFVHDVPAPHVQPAPPGQQPISGRAFMEHLCREGTIMNLPARQPLTSAEEVERERLAQKLGQGKPLW